MAVLLCERRGRERAGSTGLTPACLVCARGISVCPVIEVKKLAGLTASTVGTGFCPEQGEADLSDLQVGEYYAAARLDFLVRKEEIIGLKAIETYSDRPDFLMYRSATYGPMPPGNEAVGSNLTFTLSVCLVDPGPECPIGWNN